jgi:hypothetical protein
MGPLLVCGGFPRSGAGDIPTVKIFRGYGDEPIEDQRSARTAIFCVGCIAELREEGRAEVLEVVRVAPEHRFAGRLRSRLRLITNSQVSRGFSRHSGGHSASGGMVRMASSSFSRLSWSRVFSAMAASRAWSAASAGSTTSSHSTLVTVGVGTDRYRLEQIAALNT